MKKITHSLVAMFALIATTAFAVDPVAVWVGNQMTTESTQNGITINLNGNTCSDGVVTIASGIDISKSSGDFAKAITVIAEIEDMPTDASDSSRKTIFCCKVAGNDLTLDSVSNGKFMCDWNHGTHGSSAKSTDTIPSGKHIVAFAYDGGNKTGVKAYVDGTQKVSAGLFTSTTNIDKFFIGSYKNGMCVTSGMKVSKIAVFSSMLSAADVAAYEFPEPEPEVEYETLTYNGFLTTTFVDTGWQFDLTKLTEYEITGTMSGGNIANKPAASTGYWVEGPDAKGVMKFQMQVYQYNHATDHWLKAVEVELKQGDNGNIWIRGVRAGYVDGGSTDPRGSIKIPDWNATFVSSETGGGYGVNKVVVKVPVNPIEGSAAEIKADQSWSDLDWDTKPTASDKAEITVSASAKLTFDGTTAFQSLKLIGANNLTIAGITSANIGLISKIKTTSFTGNLTFEIDASAGLTADTALKNYIRAASGKVTFVFKSTVSSKGATLDYGTANLTDGKSLGSHIVFDGGAHTFQYRCEYAGLKFGANATAENPTIRVTNNATLTFAARNLCGWTSGNADANGIIRVDNGSKLNLNPTGGTLYWAQQFYLEPGAQLTYSDGANFRINGGTNYAPQIFVPSSDTDMTATPAKIIRSGNNDFCVNGQGTKGMAISVGENSKLIIESGIALDNTNCDIIKLGGGVLAVTGNIVNQNFTVDAGIVSLCGSITMLTLNENGVLDIDNGTPTVTGSLVTATEKQLKLAITSPIHGMSVITLPDAADKTGWTAYVNDRAEPNELTVDGNTLKLKWKIPPTITIDANNITIEPTSDWNGGTVKIDVSGLDKGDYKEDGDITYRLRFGDEKSIVGEVNDDVATFVLDDYFTAGNIYRGTFELGYGDAGDTITAADVIVYEGKLTYVEKDPWVNETPNALGKTGTYDPASGVKVEDNMIQINTNKEVTFTPTPDPDYVDKCDSSFTIKISADEAIDDDDQTIEEGAQAGVQIVADGKGGAKFQFIAGDKWVDGPAAELNKLYEVTISFHYAKEDGDEDSVTYAVGEWKESYDRRANTANKVEEIIFYDGTQFASLVGTCQIEKADPVAQGIKPGEVQEIIADNDVDAQKAAEKIPVMIPEDNDVKTAIGANESGYKALFKVVAVKKNGSYTAEVVFADDAIPTIKEEEDDILSKVVAALGSLVGEEGTLENIKGQPGLYYGIADGGELVNMGEAQPEEWKIADKDGNIIGLKVKKTGKQGFYKVICTPVKPAKKDN